MDVKNKKLINHVRTVRSRTGIEKEPIVASKTLSIGRQEDKYFLDTSTVVLFSKTSQSVLMDRVKLEYKIYIEAIKSLMSNVNFILSLPNLNSVDKNGNIITLRSLKESSYSYPEELRSAYSSSKSNKTISSESNMVDNLIYVLEESHQIIEKIEKSIALPLVEENPNLKQTFEHTKELKNKYIYTGNLIISMLKQNKLNLEEFTNEITFAEKVSTGNFK